MQKRALITGITGQDGSYLAEFLLSKNYLVFGLERRVSSKNRDNIKHVESKIDFISGDLSDQNSLTRAIQQSRPDEIYNLAAQSFVKASWDQPEYTGNITGLGVLRILEAIREIDPKIKFYQASSSEMFGHVQQIPQTEQTPFYPRSPYGVAKLYGHWITINYRESYNIFACTGILFNHESPRRGLEFVTRKITNALIKIKAGLKDKLYLGNIEAKRDWGYAADYVKAMWLMLQQPNPDNYVIATNETHSVREFIEESCKYLEIDLIWEGKGLKEKGINQKTGKIIIEIDPKYFRPAEVNMLIGDYSKAKKKLGWEPKVKFDELVKIMIEADLKKNLS